MKCYHCAAIAVAALIAFTGAVLGYSNGQSFEGVTGAPGETTCADCHGNLNTGSGSVNITAPAGYELGDTLDITIDVQHTGQTRWGFESTVLDGSDLPVGEIVVTDAVRTVKSTAVSGREYIKQTLDGTDQGTQHVTSWSFKWVAPATDVGAVTFYVASVAGNGASGPNGDYTYTTNHTMLVTGVREVDQGDLPSRFSLGQNYPNPFNPSTTIEFTLDVRSAVKLAVFNVLGQRVKTLHEGVLPAGVYRTVWDGTDDGGEAMATGAYFCRLEAGDHNTVRKMLLIK